MELTQDYLKSLFNYCPETGLFTRLTKTNRNRTIGEVAGSKTLGYIVINISKKPYRAHRLAWLYMTGAWPKYEIDHINMIRDDNRWINLREATRSENNANRRKKKNCTSEFKGVSAHQGQWRAVIKVRGRYTFIGLYDTPEKAHSAYCAAADKHYGKFANYG